MMGGQGFFQQGFTGGDNTPERHQAIRNRIQSRIAWLERNLQNVEGWKWELEVLRKMLEAAGPSEDPA